MIFFYRHTGSINLFFNPRQLRNSASLMSGTLSYNQLLAVQAKAASNNTSSGKPSQSSASKTPASGTQASSATASIPKQSVTTPLSKPNSSTSAPKVAGNLQGGSSTSTSSTTVNQTASSFYASSTCIPTANQSVSPVVSAPNTISIQKSALNLPVNTSIPPANPQVASSTMTSTRIRFVNIAPKNTNALAMCPPTSTVQAVPGSSSAATAGSLVTSASKEGFSSSQVI